MENKENQVELIRGEAFENALVSAANLKMENLTSVKTRNKDNYSRFYDIMVMSRRDIQSILDKRKKDRSDDDNNMLKTFKKETSLIYRQICQLIVPEQLEEGEQTKIQKIVQKIAPIVKLMEYIGHKEIESEFAKYGITFNYTHLMDSETVFENEQIESDIRGIFETGKNLRVETDNNNEAIKSTIFETSVPYELQFDKNSNPTGIKSSDFCKLVDIQTKLMMAKSEEDKEKVDEKANDLAGEIEFTNARNKLMQSKLIDLQSFGEDVTEGDENNVQ